MPNQHFSYCAMGASVFDKGVSAIKATDEALTSLLAHLRVARPKMFVADELIEKKARRGATGSPSRVPTGSPSPSTTPSARPTTSCSARLPGPEGVDPLKVVQPDMRIADNERAINTGLKMLSITCGLGDQYWAWDHKDGLKTATEVVSDSSMLARTLRKHQNALRGSIAELVRGVAGVCRHLCGTSVDPMAEMSIDFDDSIITDTPDR